MKTRQHVHKFNLDMGNILPIGKNIFPFQRHSEGSERPITFNEKDQGSIVERSRKMHDA